MQSLMVLAIFLTSLFAASAKATTKDCIWLLFNREAKVQPQTYAQPNARTLEDYTGVFGHSYQQGLDKTSLVIDSGSGYGFSVLELIDQKKIRGVAINAQDNYGLITQTRNWGAGEWKSKMVIRYSQDGFAKLESFNGLSDQLIAQIAKHMKFDGSVFRRAQLLNKDIAPAFYQKQILELGNKITEFQKSGKFTYEVGYAEAVFPKYKNQATVVTDLWGAYSYSPTRLELLANYYDALVPGGKAYVLIPQNRLTSGFGFQELKYSFDKSLQSYVTERYPSVFQTKMVRGQNYKGWTVLEITKDPKIPALDFSRVKIKRIVNEDEIQRGKWAPPIVELE